MGCPSWDSGAEKGRYVEVKGNMNNVWTLVNDHV